LQPKKFYDVQVHGIFKRHLSLIATFDKNNWSNIEKILTFDICDGGQSSGNEDVGKPVSSLRKLTLVFQEKMVKRYVPLGGFEVGQNEEQRIDGGCQVETAVTLNDVTDEPSTEIQKYLYILLPGLSFYNLVEL